MYWVGENAPRNRRRAPEFTTRKYSDKVEHVGMKAALISSPCLQQPVPRQTGWQWAKGFAGSRNQSQAMMNPSPAVADAAQNSVGGGVAAQI